MVILSFLLFCLYCVSGCKEGSFFKDAGPLVKTNAGTVIGKYVKVFDTDVVAFFGIPFAKPPVAELRFAKPKPIDSWNGILRADTKPPPCVQYHSRNFAWFPVTTPSEDCLYLNIWSRSRRYSHSQDKLPVLVWIHGGGYTGGSTDMPIYDGSVIASHGEAIVVSMNYRLGIFGFLNGGTEEISGNAGLLDQRLAMEWVKDNIQFFGGDPESITLFGESAGAMSISLHMISPLSKGLFNRAILQSGTMYNPILTDSTQIAVMKGNSVAKYVGCANDDGDLAKDPTAVIDCLRKKDALELAKSENKITDKGAIFFLPSVGDEFLPKTPIESYETGDISQVDVLIGGVRDEGTIFLSIQMPELFSSRQSPKVDLAQAEKLFPAMFPNISEHVSNLYLRNMKEGETATEAIANAFGDFYFNCPMMFFTKKLDNAYMYLLTHRSLKDLNADWVGVHHFYDVPYVFGIPIIDNQHYTPEDKKFSFDMIQKWVHFARNGHPLPEESRHLWPKYSTSHPVAMELNPRSSATIQLPRQQFCEGFWKSILTTKPQPSFKSVKA